MESRGGSGGARPPLLWAFFDVESDGPAPPVHSALSVGAVLVDARTAAVVDTWSANLRPLQGAAPHPPTMEFWGGHPDAWAATTEGAEDPAVAVPRLRAWIEAWAAKGYRLEPVAKPACVDWPFVSYYLWRFTSGNPFGSAHCLCAFTYLWALGGTLDPRTPLRRLSGRWVPERRGPKHVALEDARVDAVVFARMVLDRGAAHLRLSAPRVPSSKRPLAELAAERGVLPPSRGAAAAAHRSHLHHHSSHHRTLPFHAPAEWKPQARGPFRDRGIGPPP